MYAAYTQPPYFFDDQEISATSLRILRDNHIILDSMAQRGFQAQRIRNINAGVGVNPFYIWRGSFQYKTGLTSAVIKMNCPVPVGETFIVKFNGVTAYSAAMTNNNNPTITIPGSFGFQDGDIVLVDILAQYPTDPIQNQYIMQEAYVQPITGMVTTTWAAPTTFGTLTHTRLNELVIAQNYLYERLSAPAMPLQMSLKYQGGYWLPEETPWVMATYRFARHGNNDRLKVIIDYRSRMNRSSRIRFLVNNTSLDNFVFGQWQSGFYEASLDISGLTLDTPARLEIVEDIFIPAEQWKGAVNTKYAVRLVETYRNAGYIAPTLPTESQMLESMTFSTLQSRLNTLGTAMATLKSDIDSRGYLLDRSYMFSRRPVDGDEQETEKGIQNINIARKKRQGDVIVVRGKDIRIGWGYEKKSDPDKPEYEFSREETLISGDAVETKVFYLDRFDGLEYGFPYFIMGGQIEYAGEYYTY